MSKIPEITVFVGPGGVGKTTLSSAYAVRESRENKPKKYKLITIDPSKRLKDIFNMSYDEKEKDITNNLRVSLNQRADLFNAFLAESLTKDGLLEDFYKSRILKSLLDDLSIAQEFTTFYELYSSIQSGKYDHIIIDTPPLQNTADFMTSVDKLENLFSSKILSLFLAGDHNKGFIYRMIYKSREVSFKLLKALTGEDFINELDVFFKVTELLRLRILEVVRKCRVYLNDHSKFFLVCNHTELSLKALSLSLWALEKNSNMNLEKAFINKYDVNAYPSVNNALKEVQKKIKTQTIQKNNIDLTKLDNLVLLLSK